ncbi:Rrf2 family transcriptional regulator [Candidatus Uhrbacteria bacterium]|nr:Rrf2 family transcriptional regulator [Candidatus Uhrbacteria bacterium]
MATNAVIPTELSRYFRISSRSHHGLVFVSELAKTAAVGKPMSIRTIAVKMHISEGYLEELVACLRKGGIVRSARGRSGGYVLAKPIEQITMGEIIRLLDGPVMFAHCQDPSAPGPCPAEGHCASRHFFGKLKSAIDRELDSTTFADFV